MTPVCQGCWDELEPEGRFQWALLLVSTWAQQSRAQPESAHANWILRLEHARRIIFEGEYKGYPQFGPNYLPYQACYTNLGEHQLAALPALGLQICIACRAWFNESGDPCLPKG